MSGLVQLSVRVSPSLRARLREAASLSGRSLQDFVTDALERALEEPVGDSDLETARRALAAVLSDGSYQRYVAAIDDPDLRSG